MKKKDELESLLDGAEDITTEKKQTPKTAYDSKVLDDKDTNLDLSGEELAKQRLELLDSITEKIKSIRKQIKEDDLQSYMLENKIEILEKAKYMLNEYMITVLTNLSSSSRAYEVFATMLKTVTEINESIVEKESSKKAKSNKGKKETELLDSSIKNAVDEIMKQNLKANFKNKEKKEIKVVGKK